MLFRSYQGYVLDFSAETADFDDSFYFELTEIEDVDPDADTKLLFAYGFEPGETFGNKGENAWEVVLPIDGGTVVCGEIDDPLNYARNGYGSMFVENPERGAGFWTNGVCMKDLKFSENTSYRVTFWVKGDGFSMVDGLQNQIKVNAYKGGTWSHLIVGAYDGSFENEDGTEGAYLEYTTQYGAEEGGELTEDEWKMKTYMFYYPTNEYMQQTWEKNGNESTLSEDYRLEFNVYGQGKFAIDDISVYKSTIAGVTYKDNTLLVDFGFAIDSEYVWDNDDMVVIYPASAFKVTANDERVPVVRRELYPDGKIRLFLSESVSANDVVKVSFRNPVNDGENCLYYGSMLHPGSTDTEFDDWKVKNFTNEKATYDGTLEIVRTPLINEVEDQEDTFDEEIEAGIATQRVSGLEIEVKGDNITVSSEKSDVVTINIYNTLGSLVMQKQVVSGASVSTKSLQKGVYIVRASAKGENSKVIKTEL